jgi:Abortive infection alpha
LAEFGTTVVAEGGQLARYMGRVLGTAPEDAVGLVLGTPLHFVRTVIARTLDQLVSKIFERRGVTDTQPVSPSLAIPLLRAAYDESRPELQQLWAELTAAAMDPKRSGRVRLSFIDTLKRFDPLDALLLKGCHDRRGSEPDAIEYFMKSLTHHAMR